MKACALTFNGLDDGENNVKEVEPGVKIKKQTDTKFYFYIMNSLQGINTEGKSSAI